MDKVKWVKKAFLTVGLTAFGITLLIGLLFGTVVEATLFGEVMKWLLMAVLIGLLVCGILFAPIMIAADRRAMLWDEYGKRWWIEDLLRPFRKKDKK